MPNAAQSESGNPLGGFWIGSGDGKARCDHLTITNNTVDDAVRTDLSVPEKFRFGGTGRGGEAPLRGNARPQAQLGNEMNLRRSQ